MMLRRAWFVFLFIFLVMPSGVMLLPERANAAAFGLVPCALQNDDPATSWKENEPCTLCHLLLGMQRIVTLIRNIMTAIAIAVIVAMAIIYITSAGNESQISFAKEGIKYSLIGFVIILLAWLVVNFIFTLPLFEQNGLVRTDWDSFSCNATSKVNTGSTVASSARGIGNASGDSGTRGPGRGENPGTGTTPPRTKPPGLVPQCSPYHYACVSGTVSTQMETEDKWTWRCAEASNGFSVVCEEQKAGCGNNIVDAGEACDTGGARGSCPQSCSLTCQENSCSVSTAWGCGPSNGSSGAPTSPICTGDAVASSVTTTEIGTGYFRYDWTCSKNGLTQSCASGDTVVNGEGTALCGSASGVATATPPSSGHCGTGSYLVGYGIVDTGTEFRWSCNTCPSCVATNCSAPKSGNGSGTGGADCSAGYYSWSNGSYTCTGYYGAIANQNGISVSDYEGEAWGSIGLMCNNGSVSPSALFGQESCYPACSTTGSCQ